MPTASFPAEQSKSASDNEELLCARAWQQFQSLFPTEEDCWRELYMRLKSNGLAKCHHCNSQDLDENLRARARKCKNCHKKTWLTAGTFFDRMRLARPWLAAIWLAEQGVVISSSKLHILVGIAQSSALHILKKIATVIESHFPDDASLLPSRQFLPLFYKRSRLTPARAHPSAEQEEFENNLQNDSNSSNLFAVSRVSPPTSTPRQVQDIQSLIEPSTKCTASQNNLHGQAKAIYALLSKEPISCDALCSRTGFSASEMAATLTILEIDGLAERLPGDRYIRPAPKQVARHVFCTTTRQTKKMVSKFIKFVRSKFHGLSRKYLQHYLAMHWCQMARNRWCNGSLFDACLQFGSISYEQILAYVSPLMVKNYPELT